MRRRDNGISNDKNKNNNKARARPKTSTSRGGFTTVPTYTYTHKLIIRNTTRIPIHQTHLMVRIPSIHSCHLTSSDSIGTKPRGPTLNLQSTHLPKQQQTRTEQNRTEQNTSNNRILYPRHGTGNGTRGEIGQDRTGQDRIG